MVAVVGVGSRLVDRALQDLRFRDYYQAAVLAINRKGTSLTQSKISSVILKEGDSLLLEASEQFLTEYANLETCHDFAAVTQGSSTHQCVSVTLS